MIGDRLVRGQKWGFPPFVTTQDFFKNRALSLLYTYDALTSCQKLETNGWSLRYGQIDRPTDQQTV